MPSNWIFWLLFNLFVVAMLALDLGVFHRKKHVVQFREAIGWTVLWMGLAAVFCRLPVLLGAHPSRHYGTVQFAAHAGVHCRLRHRAVAQRG